MDEELKAQFHKQFTEMLKVITGPEGKPRTLSEYEIGQWFFTRVPKFIEDVFEVGKEVGVLQGRLKGYEKGVEDEIKRQKKALDELSKLN